MPNISESRP